MKWSNMAGDDKRRFCEQCQLHVHNLSQMDEAEQRELLLHTRERRCVTYEMQEGVTPVSVEKWRVFQRLRRCAALLAALLPMAFTQCSTPPPTSSPAASTTSAAQPCHQEKTSGMEKYDGKMMLTGVIAPLPQPLWRRILFFWES